MRVIAGKAKGLRLSAPSGLDIRPTSDRAKESIFNVIQDRTAGARVLDLFAGTGSLGIEALSRGAKEVVFVERDRKAAGTIRKNIKKALFLSEAMVIEKEVKSSLPAIKAADKRFDLIFLDPPYKIEQTALKDILRSIVELDLLNESGLLIVEHSSRIELMFPETLSRTDMRKYGDTSWSILEYE